MRDCVDCQQPTGRAPQAKRCPECDRLAHKARTDAWVAANRARKTATKMAWRARNIEKVRASQRAAVDPLKEAAKKSRRDPAWRRARDKAYRASMGDELRAYQRKWRVEHPETTRAWRAANPEKARAQKLRRRAVGHIGSADVKAVLEASDHVCAYCLRPGKTIDHVLPVSRGGTNHLANLVVACGSCNSAKRDTTPLEFVFKLQRLGVAGPGRCREG